MFNHVLVSLKGYQLSYIKNDIIAGIMVAALTIPVAMGYATVAGLPPIYGLYASILPAIGYVIFASSREIVFGIDAAASAITGSVLAAFGIAAGSQDAMTTAALLSLFSGVFLIVFAIFKLGRFAEYISMPVMSGFMSGLALSIILSQVPKILGITSGGDDFFTQVSGIFSQLGSINYISLAFGAATVVLVLLGKKFARAIPVGLIIMIGATALCGALGLDSQGVSIVGTIPQGFPPVSLPDIFGVDNIGAVIGASFMISIVIFASSITPAASFAAKNHYELDSNREIFAYGVSNLFASISGCSPTSASVSRTVVSQQFRGKTQVVGLVSAASIVLVVLFLSGLLYYMPQPVLGGIVFAALVSTVDVGVVISLFRRSRREMIIWLASAVGVLVVGTLFGVAVGVFMSFIDVIMRITSPPQAYLGRIKGRDGYFDLKDNDSAKPIPGIAIYRFSARLFFGNIDMFKQGIQKAVDTYHPRLLIIDASGINSVDATAVETLRTILESLTQQKVQYYFAGQIETVNQQFQELGLSDLVEGGHAKKTIDDAIDAYRSAAHVMEAQGHDPAKARN